MIAPKEAGRSKSRFFISLSVLNYRALHPSSPTVIDGEVVQIEWIAFLLDKAVDIPHLKPERPRNPRTRVVTCAQKKGKFIIIPVSRNQMSKKGHTFPLNVVWIEDSELWSIETQSIRVPLEKCEIFPRHFYP
jgi:hypothetical protein